MLAVRNSGNHGDDPPPSRAAAREEPVVVSHEIVVGGKSTWIYEFHVPCHSAPDAAVEPERPDGEGSRR